MEKRRGKPRRNPADPKYVAIDQAAAENEGMTLEQFRAQVLNGYDNETGQPIIQALVSDIECLQDLPEALNQDGTPNPDHYRKKFKFLADQAFRAAAGEITLPRGFKVSEVLSLLKEEARIYGLDPDRLADTRTESEKAMDAAKILIDAPDELMAQTDATLTAIDSAMNAADQYCCELIGAPGTAKGIEIDQNATLYESARLAKKKIAVWRTRLARLKALRKRVREDVPEGKTDWREVIAYTAAGELRWTIYMLRPDKIEGESQFGVQAESNNTMTYQVGVPHAKMVICDYVAENGIKRDMRFIDHHDCLIGYVLDPEGPLEGTIHSLAPGHGKSTRMHGKISRMIARNPRQRWIFLHAQEAMAQRNQKHVASFFDPNTAQGRRLLSFYPDLKVETANETEFRLVDPKGERQSAPTITASGAMGRRSGADADRLWFDDYVDAPAAEQDASRKRDFTRMNMVWLRRIRGRGFHYTTTTLWHHEDANAIRIAQVKNGTLRVGICILPCGGPNSPIPFEPIWPEQYPARFLRATFNAMRDIRKYSAAFMCDPQPDEMRKVKALAHFLRELPETPGPETTWAFDQMGQHRRFLQSAAYYVSIDGSATNHDKSDKASFTYWAVGDLTDRVEDEMGYKESSRRVARLLDARQFHANQTECVEVVGAFAASNKVDHIIVETRSAFQAMAEIFWNMLGIRVIRIDPLNRNKILRLQDVAPMMDARLALRGLPPPVLEFPGKVQSMVGGIVKMAICDEFAWLETQLLDAGMCSEDHGLDTVTQFAKHIGHEMGCGMGAITQQILNQQQFSPRQLDLNRMVEGYAVSNNNQNAAQADWRFACAMGN